MKSIKLVAFDLDGTLLREDKTIPEENLEALKAARDAGIVIAPATGRLMDNMPEEIAELCRYFILINGAAVYDRAEDRYFGEAVIDTDLAMEIYGIADTLPCLYDAYLDYHGYMTESMHARLEEYMPNKAYARTMTAHRKPVPDLKKHILETGASVQKIQWYFKSPAERDEWTERLNTRFAGRIYASHSLNYNIEINSAEAVKGRGLEKLCAYLGITPEDCIAFGDGTNDLSLIERAGIGVCMKNGADECKAVADVISGKSNDEAGFAAELLARI